MKKIALIPGIMILFTVCGCDLTTDPSRGGFFSYNPEAYEQRLEERRERLREFETQEIAEQQRRQNLNRDAASQRRANQEMQSKLKAVNADISKLRRNLDNFKATNDKQAVALKNLQTRLARVNDDMSKVQTSETMTDDEKRVEAERLKREINRLVKEADILSKL